MMICPPDWYQAVDWTEGMKLDRNAPESANSFASVSVGTPVWPSSVRFGVYQTKSGGEALFRSGMSAEESLTVIGAFGKYSQGLCLTA